MWRYSWTLSIFSWYPSIVCTHKVEWCFWFSVFHSSSSYLSAFTFFYKLYFSLLNLRNHFLKSALLNTLKCFSPCTPYLKKDVTKFSITLIDACVVGTLENVLLIRLSLPPFARYLFWHSVNLFSTFSNLGFHTARPLCDARNRWS